MRVVMLIVAMAALWVSPARAATVYDFTIYADATGTATTFNCFIGGPINCTSVAPAAGSFLFNISLPISDFADGSQFFGYGNSYAIGQFNGTIFDLGNGDFTGVNFTYKHEPLCPNSCVGVLTNLSAPTFIVRAAGAVPEPATWAMMLIGFAAIGGVMRRGPRHQTSTRASL